MLTEKRAQHLAGEGSPSKRWSTISMNGNDPARHIPGERVLPMMRNDILGLGPSKAPSWPADYLTRPDDDIVPAYPPGGIRVAIVGGDVSSTIQAWKLQLHRSVSVDDWR
jgi:hypothetical protein